MTFYYSVVQRLIEDHFSEEDKANLIKDLSVKEMTGPKGMSKEDIEIERIISKYEK